ncbi:MAG: hypothetical protein ABFD82_06020 [Syntrophaceae bacterium]
MTCTPNQLTPSSGSYIDWTDYFDISTVIREVNDLIDDLILEIHGKRLKIHAALSVQELALIYRFPVHVGANIFIERLFRVAYSREMNWFQSYPEVSYVDRYFKYTDEAIAAYYTDFDLNKKLLHQIFIILGGPSRHEGMRLPKAATSQHSFPCATKSMSEKAKEILKSLAESYVEISTPEVVGEYSNWMREILPFSKMHRFEFPVRQYPVDENARQQIRDCCRHVFRRRIGEFPIRLEKQQIPALEKLFAGLIDRILPQSVVEGLTERFTFFEKKIAGWNVKQVHSFIGYYYKENFKIFAILARRRGSLLIGFAHGASNPICTYKQSRNELAFLDIYFTWGKNDSSWMKGNLKQERLKMVDSGSTYLSTITKWKKTRIDPENVSILFPSGPLMDFMGDLQEITPEVNYQNRLNVILLFKKLWESYPKLKVLYKPFPGTYTNDPARSLFEEEFKRGSVELIQEKPSTLYEAVDIVLWDTISTGFCESISSGVPTLVFQSRSEYDQAVPLGKSLDEALTACGMLFYDVDTGIKSFQRIINELDSFLQGRIEAVRKFQEATAYPITKQEFLASLHEALQKGS